MGPEEVVVFDTNVLVSAVGWRGPEHEIYQRCRAGELRLAISPELLAELERVLRYPKLEFAEEEIEAFISDLLEHAMTVSPSQAAEVGGPGRRSGHRVRAGRRGALDRLRRQPPARSRGVRGHHDRECGNGNQRSGEELATREPARLR